SFTSEGTKTIYAWVKDAAGNVSESAKGQLVITLIVPKPETNDGNTEKLGNILVSNLVSTVPNRRAMPVTFNNGGV
ncbi:MAG TPA: hypothetical protein PLC80_13830, partial [Draconibacterium sp.]|nr:hypothetical protein [Draconibacterium sp.]